MSLELDDQKPVDEAIADVRGSTKILVRDPAQSQKLGWFDVSCNILNRTIGASLFTTYTAKREDIGCSAALIASHDFWCTVPARHTCTTSCHANPALKIMCNAKIGV